MYKVKIKIISIILLMMLCVSGFACAQENDSTSALVKITVVGTENYGENNTRLTAAELQSDVPAYIVEGTTMVPLRALVEWFGYDVDYQPEDKKIIIQDTEREKELIFTIGSTTVSINDRLDTMLQAPVIRADRTFIPLRYVSEFFGKYVTWMVSVEGSLYVWVSSVQLLTNEDVAVEDDTENYNLSYYTVQGDEIYELKSNGQTCRGAKIGDSYEQVVQLYGEPHGAIAEGGVIQRINYRHESALGLNHGGIIIFYFEDGVIDHVEVRII
jgi:Copper amine oxidase N-terminal domain.